MPSIVPPITNVVEISVQGSVVETGGTARNIFNVFHYYQNPNQPSPPSAVVVANAFIAGPWAGILALLSIGYVGVQTLARYLDVTTNAFQNANAPGNGAVALPRQPAQQAVVGFFRTAVRGKSFRGSKHFGPLATAQVTGDEIAPASVAAWQAAITALVANITAGGQSYTPCVVSKTLSQLRTDPVTIIGAAKLTGLTNKTIGTMRHRKEKTVR
jgi:hypothetical protein